MLVGVWTTTHGQLLSLINHCSAFSSYFHVITWLEDDYIHINKVYKYYIQS